MKKLLAVWALAALAWPCLAGAVTVNIASDGTMWIEKPVTKIELQFGPGVSDYGDAWKQAYAKPGTLVSVKSHSTVKREGLFHIVKTEVADVGIRYDNMKSIGLVHDVAGTPKVSFNPSAILWLLSVAAVVFGVLRMRENKDVTFAIVFAIVVTFTIVAATLAAAPPLVPLALVATFALVAALVAAASDNKKMFYILVGIYGVSMAVSMMAFLLS